MQAHIEQMKNIWSVNARSSLADRRPPVISCGPDVADLSVYPGVHEFYAASSADAVTVNGFCLGMALSRTPGRGLVWAVHERGAGENGRPHGSGLHEMGLSPDEVMLVRVGDIRTLLGVGEDALRTRGVGTVLLSAWGEDRAFNLTASRRLSLAAGNNGKRLFLARAGAAPHPSAAESRWSVRSAPSTPLEGGAPGRPAFSATLLRSRAGASPATWIMEWDREGRSFVEPAALSGSVAPVAAQRPAAASGSVRRHA